MKNFIKITLFLSIIVTKFNNTFLAYSCILLFLFSLFISLPSLIFIKKIKNHKIFFIVSTIFTILNSYLVLLLRQYTSFGIINFSFYLYTKLFMLIPFYSFFTLSIHKLCIPIKKTKQLAILIVLKKLFIIILITIFSFILQFQQLLVLISLLDCILNITSPLICDILFNKS